MEEELLMDEELRNELWYSIDDDIMARKQIEDHRKDLLVKKGIPPFI